MANHPSAKKRHRQSLKRRERSRHWRAAARTAVRRVREGVAEGAADLPERVRSAESLLRRASSKGVLHSKTTSRTVSRLAKLLQRPS